MWSEDTLQASLFWGWVRESYPGDTLEYARAANADGLPVTMASADVAAKGGQVKLMQKRAHGELVHIAVRTASKRIKNGVRKR